MWGPPVPQEAGDAALPDFEAQCQTILTVAPKVVSSIMGLYRPGLRIATQSARNPVACHRYHGCRGEGC